MLLLSWLSHRAPEFDTPLPESWFSAQRSLNTVEPSADEDEEDATSTDDGISLDELLCLIDYCGASGEVTRRRITLRKIARGPHAPILSAVCHERRAFRHFRCDRIEGFITEDGEVISCDVFFRDTLLLNLAELAPSAAQQALPAARQIRDRLRPALSLLVTTAQADGEFHPEELDAICHYVEAELMEGTRCEEFRDDVTVEVLDQITNLVRYMRPQRNSIAGYLSQVLDYNEADRERLARAIARVIAADGILRDEEAALLEELDMLAAQQTAESYRRFMSGHYTFVISADNLAEGGRFDPDD